MSIILDKHGRYHGEDINSFQSLQFITPICNVITFTRKSVPFHGSTNNPRRAKLKTMHNLLLIKFTSPKKPWTASIALVVAATAALSILSRTQLTLFTDFGRKALAIYRESALSGSSSDRDDFSSRNEEAEDELERVGRGPT
jgi:hypothetical protein